MPRAPRFAPTKVEAALMAAKRLARALDEVRAIDYGIVYVKEKATARRGIRFH